MALGKWFGVFGMSNLTAMGNWLFVFVLQQIVSQFVLSIIWFSCKYFVAVFPFSLFLPNLLKDNA